MECSVPVDIPGYLTEMDRVHHVGTEDVGTVR